MTPEYRLEIPKAKGLAGLLGRLRLVKGPNQFTKDYILRPIDVAIKGAERASESPVERCWLVHHLAEHLARLVDVEVTLTEFTGKVSEHGWTVDAQSRYWSMPLLSANLGLLLKEQSAGNYLTCTLQDMSVPNGRMIELTIAYQDGLTPADKIAQLEDENQALQARVKALESGAAQ
jgi:hypothetical protein